MAKDGSLAQTIRRLRENSQLEIDFKDPSRNSETVYVCTRQTWQGIEVVDALDPEKEFYFRFDEIKNIKILNQ